MAKYSKKPKKHFYKRKRDSESEKKLLSSILSFSDTTYNPKDLAESLLNKYLLVNRIMDLGAAGMLVNEGIDEDTIFLFKLILEASARQLVQAGIGTVLRSPKEASRFFEETYRGRNDEELRLVCLNDDLRIVDYAIIARGNQHTVTFNKSELLERVLNSGCSLCILAHNHPGVPSTPSDADFKVTNMLIEYFDKFGIRLVEHIIIGADGAKCMISENMLSRFFE